MSLKRFLLPTLAALGLVTETGCATQKYVRDQNTAQNNVLREELATERAARIAAEEKAAQLQQKKDEEAARVQALKEAALKERLEGIEKNVGETAAEVGTLKQRVTKTEEGLTAVEGRVTLTEKQIKTLKAAFQKREIDEKSLRQLIETYGNKLADTKTAFLYFAADQSFRRDSSFKRDPSVDDAIKDVGIWWDMLNKGSITDPNAKKEAITALVNDAWNKFDARRKAEGVVPVNNASPAGGSNAGAKQAPQARLLGVQARIFG